ncbi:hypothetical protein [Celeribacter neptunius]|uniref:hypothetical protein n=1 Tax=Celeribacter neptunius TaxID=588602 RepID=UPI000B7F8C71|nr:hypothetical protein [Celeribacter neptunius]
MAEPQDILNWRLWSAHITLSGQPDRAQISALAASGVSHVLNLALPDQASALAGEAQLVEEAGMRYTNIPVAFEAPTEQDFDRFC